MSGETTDKAGKIARLREQIAGCRRCALHETRTLTVPGEGDPDADIMFIGEAPGRNEDRQGKPFVGRAGDIFDRLLASVELTRDQIYLCNILKCRPPNNRNPLVGEIQACVGSLDLQIKIVNPSVIGTLGNFATMYILEKFGIPLRKISELAGTSLAVESEFGPKRIVPLYHPAVATYSPTKIDTLLEHFQVFRESRLLAARRDPGA
ncbi:MAG: uracil-DNA glycosylase [Candidatus Omnitrophica bacterium]|nr:uracil-DNA glycosylase [Candidatus Omnitrophota bacterium]